MIYSKVVRLASSALLGFLLLVNTVYAGGPENLLLVVNANSPSSLLLANHYISLRNIPEINVIYLDNVPNQELSTLAKFRETIMVPIVEQVEARQLSNIDYIVYSSDFPSLYHIGPHVDKLFSEAKKLGKSAGSKKLFNHHASLNSLTYYARQVLVDDPTYISLNSNAYYRGPARTILRTPFLGEDQTKFQEAKRLGTSGDYQSAIEALIELEKRNPNQVALLYSLAQLHAQNGESKEAAKWLGRAVSQGWVYRTQTESDKAFAKAIDDPVFRGILNRIPDEPFEFAPAMGFKSRYSWANNGSKNGSPTSGRRYFISTVLGVTRNYGCTEREALGALKRNAVVDGTHPNGIFYFADTKDVRNRTRKPNYKSAINALEALGMKTRVITDKIPIKQDRVMGLTNGTARFNWNAGGSTLLAGAICDNLTSHGGMLNRASQTKCTTFLAAGAAGASGTVIEPYALQAKFPHPMIHARYAKGCTLGEAFYQSVHGPFQLLIVGDALCQPFANKPTFQADGLKAQETVSGTVEVNLDYSESPVAVGDVEVYLDGKLINRVRQLESVKFNSSHLPDGYHELRIVAIADNLLETTGGKIFPIVVANKEQQVNVSLDSKSYKESDTVTVQVESNFGERLVLKQNFRELGSAEGRKAKFKLSAANLGRGPVKLTAFAMDENDVAVSSVPYAIQIIGPLSDVAVKPKPKPKK